MTPIKHCQISQKRWGGVLEDYLPIHEFIDSTKILCADNRHRILHTHWALDNVVLPLFGHTLINSDGKMVPVKEMVERDHLLADYRNQFIPTLNDFIVAIDDIDISDIKIRIESFHMDFSNTQISQLLLSPLAATGKIKSLLITHNSWFVNSIIPKLHPEQPVITEFDLSPADLFNRMKFELWMDNGTDYPPSARQMMAVRAAAD